mgnify:CR=1 FL=1
MLITRFLEKYEYVRTLKLFKECFGNDEEYIAELYGELNGENECTGTIRTHEIAVIENENGDILSMVHYKPVNAVFADGRTVSVSYIMDVATAAASRRNGYMDTLMRLVMKRLSDKKEPWCFLIAVDKAIYKHLGFVHDWVFNSDEADLLDADDGLTECSAAMLNAEVFEAPVRLEA